MDLREKRRTTTKKLRNEVRRNLHYSPNYSRVIISRIIIWTKRV
jgi:hypothetical protein